MANNMADAMKNGGVTAPPNKPTVTPIPAARATGVQAAKAAPTAREQALLAEIEALKAQNAALEQEKNTGGTFSMKVSENKRCLSIYGMGRRPVTLYASQWQKILAHAADIEQFIEVNHDRLAWKKTTEDPE